jgi:hypothetical protein
VTLPPGSRSLATFQASTSRARSTVAPTTGRSGAGTASELAKQNSRQSSRTRPGRHARVRVRRPLLLERRAARTDRLNVSAGPGRPGLAARRCAGLGLAVSAVQAVLAAPAAPVDQGGHRDRVTPSSDLTRSTLQGGGA